MHIVHTGESTVVFCGDSCNLTDELPPNSIDALVCDPPAGIGFMSKSWDKNKGGRDQWIAWLAEIMRTAFVVMKPGAYGFVWALPRTSHWTAIALEDAGFFVRDRVSHLFGTGFPKSMKVPAAGDGWGTALKPACEDWWLIRKPFNGTVAENVLKHGTGALNIDGCRIRREAGDRTEYGIDGDEGCGSQTVYNFRPEDRGAYTVHSAGRFPSNVILDPAAAAALDASVPASKSTRGKPRQGKSGEGYGMTHTGAEYSDRGGPSRFFYVTKPGRKEKDAGVTRPPATGGEATGRKDGSKGTQNPRAGAGRTGGARNIHPTIKGKTLMAWLITLITPPGGIVLDPFMGSGSTGVAAVEHGFGFVGVEQNAEYTAIAAERIAHAEENTGL